MTRRYWTLAFLATARSFGASDFWNKKDLSRWTTDDILRLATNSPWAKKARVIPLPGRDRGSLQSTGVDIAGAGGRSGNQRVGEIPIVSVTEVTVIWESAQPLLDALKTNLPRDFANHYVIGVDDLPPEEGGRKVNLESMTASLQAHGKESVDAGGIESNKGVVLFSFSKELLPLAAADKEVLFTLETNQYSVKCRFDFKEMMYHGKLAV